MVKMFAQLRFDTTEINAGLKTVTHFKLDIMRYKHKWYNEIIKSINLIKVLLKSSIGKFPVF